MLGGGPGVCTLFLQEILVLPSPISITFMVCPVLMTCTCVVLQVDDQMKLLQHSWSDMLVLDHMHQRMHNALPDETTLHNGQKFDLLSLGLLGVPSLRDRFTQVTLKLQELKFDMSDYICVKFLLLLNPGEYCVGLNLC